MSKDSCLQEVERWYKKAIDDLEATSALLDARKYQSYINDEQYVEPVDY